jgi:hypothetical protein
LVDLILRQDSDLPFTPEQRPFLGNLLSERGQARLGLGGSGRLVVIAIADEMGFVSLADGLDGGFLRFVDERGVVELFCSRAKDRGRWKSEGLWD